MKYFVPGIFIFGLFLFFTGCSVDNTPISGEIPSLSLPNLRGEVIDIGKDTNKVLLLVFWATWCQPCIMEIPSLVAINNRYKDRSFQLISVLTDEPGIMAIQNIKNNFGINYNILLGDEESGNRFGVRAVTITFLFISNHKIKYYYQNII